MNYLISFKLQVKKRTLTIFSIFSDLCLLDILYNKLQDIRLLQMLSNDAITTSRYYQDQFQHILSDLRNFDFMDFWSYLGMNPELL